MDAPRQKSGQKSFGENLIWQLASTNRLWWRLWSWWRTLLILSWSVNTAGVPEFLTSIAHRRKCKTQNSVCNANRELQYFCRHQLTRSLRCISLEADIILEECHRSLETLQVFFFCQSIYGLLINVVLSILKKACGYCRNKKKPGRHTRQNIDCTSAGDPLKNTRHFTASWNIPGTVWYDEGIQAAL